jgi:hypothetical protein
VENDDNGVERGNGNIDDVALAYGYDDDKGSANGCSDDDGARDVCRSEFLGECLDGRLDECLLSLKSLVHPSAWRLSRPLAMVYECGGIVYVYI